MRHLDAAEPQLDDRAKLWTCSEALEQARTYDGPSGVEALLAHAERMVDELGLTRSRQILREMGRYQPRCVRPRTRARQPRPVRRARSRARAPSGDPDDPEPAGGRRLPDPVADHLRMEVTA
jgi:hypothetical protein